MLPGRSQGTVVQLIIDTRTRVLEDRDRTGKGIDNRPGRANVRILMDTGSTVINAALSLLLSSLSYTVIPLAEGGPIDVESEPGIIVVGNNFDSTYSSAMFPEAKVILMDLGFKPERLREALCSNQIDGVLPVTASFPLFEAIIRGVLEGHQRLFEEECP
jgi:hypothetical protein